MIRSDPQISEGPAPRGSMLSPLQVFCCAAAVLGIAIYAVSSSIYGSLSPAAAFCTVLFALICLLGARGLAQSFPHEKLGVANLITLLRAALIALLAGLIAAPGLLLPLGWPVLAIALIAFALDGVDGWAARSLQQSSGFGARFDMETDALFGAVLALIAWLGTELGWFVLVLGLMRYAFVAASLALPWLMAPLPNSRARKTICVVQIAALIYLISPIAPGWSLMPVAALTTAALIWSFGRDTLWLMRNR